MKFTKLLLSIATLGLGVASAASSYSVNLPSPTWVGGNQLKAGDYKVEVMSDNKVAFKSGKNVVEVPATVEKADKKYPYTTLDTTESKLQEIHVGGTTTKIVFKSAPVATGGS